MRSINFETDSEFVKQQFEQFGQIKTFFDMVNKRGIAFITYYDLRSARDAMLAMKGALFGGRPINIHYSLPREEDKAQRCDRDKNQGTLFTVLKGAQQDINDDGIRTGVCRVWRRQEDPRLPRTEEQPLRRVLRQPCLPACA